MLVAGLITRASPTRLTRPRAAELRQARRLVAVPKVDTRVEHRALTDYDRLFGLDGTEEGIT